MDRLGMVRNRRHKRINFKLIYITMGKSREQFLHLRESRKEQRKLEKLQQSREKKFTLLSKNKFGNV